MTPGSSTPGYATFSGLLLNNAGNGYTLTLNGTGLTSNATTIGFNIVAAPTIISETAVYTQKVNKKDKKIGKPVFAGYMITFSTSMNHLPSGTRQLRD